MHLLRSVQLRGCSPKQLLEAINLADFQYILDDDMPTDEIDYVDYSCVLLTGSLARKNQIYSYVLPLINTYVCDILFMRCQLNAHRKRLICGSAVSYEAAFFSLSLSREDSKKPRAK